LREEGEGEEKEEKRDERGVREEGARDWYGGMSWFPGGDQPRVVVDIKPLEIVSTNNAEKNQEYN
jgi:hypothetical protein